MSLAGALAVAFPACSRFGAVGDSHQIGHLAPRSGPDQAEGKRLGEAIALVAEEFNVDESNRIDGKPITIVHADTGTNIEGFAQQATRLLSVNRVDALIGGTTSAELSKLLAPVQSTPTILVSPAGSAVVGTGKYIWPVGLHPSHRGKWLAQYSAESMKVTEVISIVDRSEPIFAELRTAFEAEFRHADRRIVSEWSFSTAAEAGELTERIVAAKPKAILFCGRAADLLRMKAALASKIPDSPVMLFAGEEEASVFRSDPDRSQGVVFVSAFTPEDRSEKVQKFCNDFRGRTGELPDAKAALSADAARVLFAAARKMQSFRPRPKPLLEAFADLEVELPTGVFRFNKDAVAHRTGYALQVDGGVGKLKKTFTAEKK